MFSRRTSSINAYVNLGFHQTPHSQSCKPCPGLDCDVILQPICTACSPITDTQAATPAPLSFSFLATHKQPPSPARLRTQHIQPRPSRSSTIHVISPPRKNMRYSRPHRTDHSSRQTHPPLPPSLPPHTDLPNFLPISLSSFPSLSLSISLPVLGRPAHDTPVSQVAAGTSWESGQWAYRECVAGRG